ncbi:MAG: hypothetical protein AAGA06_14050 [Pseudomonadota bacterium]
MTEQKALVQATAALFDRIETRSAPKNSASGFGRMQRKTGAKAGTDSDGTESLTRMGPVAHLTGYRITWYPMERLHGTVDFMGTWNGNRNLVCGYVTWDLTNPDAPELEALDASFIDLTEVSGASNSNLHRDLIAANCAYGAIEANYRVFDPTG